MQSLYFRSISFPPGERIWLQLCFFELQLDLWTPDNLIKKNSPNLIKLACLLVLAEYHGAYCQLKPCFWFLIKHYRSRLVQPEWRVWVANSWPGKLKLPDTHGWCRAGEVVPGGCSQWLVPSTCNKGADKIHYQLPSSTQSKTSSLSMLHIPSCYSPMQSQAASNVPVPSAPPGKQCPTLRGKKSYSSFLLGCAQGEERTQSLLPSETVFVHLAYISQIPNTGKCLSHALWVGTSWMQQGSTIWKSVQDLSWGSGMSHPFTTAPMTMTSCTSFNLVCQAEDSAPMRICFSVLFPTPFQILSETGK